MPGRKHLRGVSAKEQCNMNTSRRALKGPVAMASGPQKWRPGPY